MRTWERHSRMEAGHICSFQVTARSGDGGGGGLEPQDALAKGGWPCIFQAILL